MTDAPEHLYFYDDWIKQHTKGLISCGNNKYTLNGLTPADTEALVKAALERAADYLTDPSGGETNNSQSIRNLDPAEIVAQWKESKNE
jgi:hypothetical protein